MAVSLKTGDTDDAAEVSEINVTPFIDVILVLLIIFMVAAPLSTVDVAVDLPVSNAAPAERPDKPLFLTLRADRTLAFGNDDLPSGGLQARLDTATGGDRGQRVFVRADGAVAYQALMDVMNELRAAGYLKIALVGIEGPAPAMPAAP